MSPSSHASDKASSSLATADTAAAAAPHAGTSSLASQARLASSSLDMWSHATMSPSSHASDKASSSLDSQASLESSAADVAAELTPGLALTSEATADTAAAAALHAGTSSLASQARLASSSWDSSLHAASLPWSHASARAAICVASVAKSTMVAAACPHNGASSLASHALLASSSSMSPEAAALERPPVLSSGPLVGASSLASQDRLEICSADMAPGLAVTSEATADTAVAVAPHAGKSRLASQARLAASSLDSSSQATFSPLWHALERAAIFLASAATLLTAAAARPHVGASSCASHARLASSSVNAFNGTTLGAAVGVAGAAVAASSPPHTGASSLDSHACLATSW